MQIGRVLFRPRPVPVCLILRQLDQISGNKTRRQTERPKHLHQQPRRIPTRPTQPFQRLLARLHSMLQPHRIAHAIAHLRRHVSHKRDSMLWPRRNLFQKRFEQRPRRFQRTIRFKIPRHLRRILKWKVLKPRIQEERERINRRHVRDQRHVHNQLASLARKDHTRQMIAQRIELPMQNMMRRRQRQRVLRDRRLTVRSRPQLDHLRTQRDLPFIAIRRSMMQFDVNTHGYFILYASPRLTSPLLSAPSIPIASRAAALKLN